MSNHNEICFKYLVLIVDINWMFKEEFFDLNLERSVLIFDCDQVATILLFFVTIEQSMEFNRQMEFMHSTWFVLEFQRRATRNGILLP